MPYMYAFGPPTTKALFPLPRTQGEQHHLERQQAEGDEVGAPDEELVAHAPSRIMQRNRTRETAML